MHLDTGLLAVVAMSLGSVGNPSGFLALAITDQAAAQTSSQAILGVVHAVRFGNILKKS
jgi:hypothetical protein